MQKKGGERALPRITWLTKPDQRTFPRLVLTGKENREFEVTASFCWHRRRLITVCWNSSPRYCSLPAIPAAGR
jgi:hypothetical protein